MNTTLNKIASVLAFILGGLSILAGGMAARGWDPGYFVLHWLPVYNFIMGLLTVSIPAILIWRNSRYAMPAAIATFSIHAVVTLLLLSAFRGTPAAESLAAMTFRLVVWLIILVLMFFQSQTLRSK
ncbi:MAG: hypothetical protein HY864_15395 [Chloroflexi bacterium]|nr:hypothetical protein [Chloroflexota bacterium]